MKDMHLFGNFKNGPARPLIDNLGLHEIVEMASTWNDFRKSVQAYNDANNGVFVHRVHCYLEEVSGPANAILIAILFATGLFDSWRPSDADLFLENLSNATGHERDAVAACIAAGNGRATTP